MLNKKAFTLVELIVYVAISAMVVVALLSFNWNIVETGAQVDSAAELSQSGRLIFEKFSQEIHAAEDVTLLSSVFDVHPGTLTLDMAGSGTDVIFATYTKAVTLADQVVTIRKLRFTDGAASPVDLTSDKVDVANFVVSNMTRDSEAKNIKLGLTLEYVNTGTASETLSLETAASIRKK